MTSKSETSEATGANRPEGPAQQEGGNATTKKIVTIPNLLSCFRIALIPVIAWLYVRRKEYQWAGGVLLLSGVTDIADGYIARHFNMVSEVGKVLDPIADKLTQACVLLCLVQRYPLMLLPICLMAAKELFMIVCGLAILHNAQSVYSAMWHGKVASFLLDGTLVLHIFWQDIPKILSDICILLSSVMIAVSFVLYGMHNMRLLSGKEGASCKKKQNKT